MSSSGSTPLYILTWNIKPRERGRRHMAVFVANPSCKDADPAEEECLGTMIHVIGSPFGGFVLEIRRNWDRRRTRNIESVHLLCQVDIKYAPEPKSSEFLPNDPKPNGILDQIALTVRPPGVSQQL
jgi:hypothetical protein